MSVAVAPTDTVPPDAHSGRSAYFRKLIRGKPAVYTIVIGGVGAFLFGAARRDLVIMAAAPIAVVAVVMIVAAMLADRYSTKSFFRSFAAARDLEYVDRWEVTPFTPLLGAGNRRWYEHWMIGDVVKEPRLSGGLGHFFYERRREQFTSSGERRSQTIERHHLTVCTIDLEPSILLFKGIFLRHRRGVFDFGTDWLADTPSRAVEVESAAFTERYELRLANDQDELLMRQLMSPTLVSWFAGHPLAPGFELRAGTLVVFVPKLLEDGGSLTYLLDGARKIASRVLEEVAETAATEPRTPSLSAKMPGL
jgi:hypothetical protein